MALAIPEIDATKQDRTIPFVPHSMPHLYDGRKENLTGVRYYAR